MTSENSRKAVAESREKMVADLKAVIADAQELASGAKDLSTEALAEKAEEAKAKLKKGGEALHKYERCLIDQVDQCAQSTEETIRRHPWQTVGLVALSGIILGRLLKK